MLYSPPAEVWDRGVVWLVDMQAVLQIDPYRDDKFPLLTGDL
jgi:hypothetical protein